MGTLEAKYTHDTGWTPAATLLQSAASYIRCLSSERKPRWLQQQCQAVSCAAPLLCTAAHMLTLMLHLDLCWSVAIVGRV